MGLSQQTLPIRVCVSILAAVTHFTVPVSGEYLSTDTTLYNIGGLGHRPNHHYRSSTEYTPVLHVNSWNETAVAAHGGSHIFVRHDGPNYLAPSAPLILDARDLSAVYVNRSFANVFGPRVQEDRGIRYLTFWAGKKGDPEGLGDGFGLAYDANYRLVYNVSAQGLNSHADLHEFEFTGHGTVLVNAVDRMVAPTAKWEGWAGEDEYPILNAVVQEIDLDTNNILFNWRALDHINPLDTVEPLTSKEWDAFHLNSIQKTTEGNYLVSIRYTNAIYLISGTTGAILWTLGGKSNTFTELPPAFNATAPLLSMRFQHHARFVPGTNETEITLFDNHIKHTSHGLCPHGTCSRGVHFRIDSAAQTVQLLHEYLHPAQLQAQSQGSIQVLPAPDAAADYSSQHVFIGWGRCPSFTQHDAQTGATLLDVQISPWHSDVIVDALDNYRAYRMDWNATPWWDPAVQLVESREGDLEVYVSWNGATEVREWAVRGLVVRSLPVGDYEDTTEHHGEEVLLARARRTGFETRLTVARFGLRSVWAEALDEHGAVLRASERLDLVHGNVTILPWEEPQEEQKQQGGGGGGAGLSTVLGVMGAAIGAAVVWVGGRLVWKQYRTYYQLLDDGDDSDFDESGSDVDIEMDAAYASGLDMNVPEPWQDFAPRLGTLLGDSQRHTSG